MSGAVGYDVARKKIKHKIQQKIHKMVEEETLKAEQRIAEKYDLIEWDTSDLPENQEQKELVKIN